jgi:hypothetical protein
MQARCERWRIDGATVPSSRGYPSVVLVMDNDLRRAVNVLLLLFRFTGHTMSRLALTAGDITSLNRVG